LVTPSEVYFHRVITSTEYNELHFQLRTSKIERLRHHLVKVQKDQAFLLHAGDCAESFDACTHVSGHLFAMFIVINGRLDFYVGEYFKQDWTNPIFFFNSYLGY
jgi:hypothetical protein